jgi:serine/threonine protein kinase
VYNAINQETGEEVIAKRIDLSKLEDVYYHEIEIMQKMNHENIVKYISQKKVGLSGYIYMEKVNGETLYDYVNKAGKGKGLDVRVAMYLFKQFICALDYMHNVGISHHDVKTENLVVDSNSDIVKLIDFGLAINFDENMVVSPGGSPLYSAPEVLLNQLHHPAGADVWSAAVVLYYMLAGEYPWPDVNNMEELIARVANTEYERPNIKYPERIPLEIRSMLEQMFSRDPSMRPSMNQCLRTVEAY